MLMLRPVTLLLLLLLPSVLLVSRQRNLKELYAGCKSHVGVDAVSLRTCSDDAETTAPSESSRPAVCCLASNSMEGSILCTLAPAPASASASASLLRRQQAAAGPDVEAQSPGKRGQMNKKAREQEDEMKRGAAAQRLPS
ncbi:hypothetical protein M431DRAFT_485641 [Trichoderma harzianum CBS 226.95]|uniref:Hydrophobin n=1 Tax=Trichoderma harzianum CBS 226.95 TaxID=983964 RepID=A0A2T4A1V1_TRIHA|nr:hypothetical protein M431DRAFT_485641 [Trichoderma harzianum CBS 226.95]PTB50943.1 hypothetical protein M431DRAFT_485641 [Trichoderma harzianum CBS 226.95]